MTIRTTGDVIAFVGIMVAAYLLSQHDVKMFVLLVSVVVLASTSPKDSTHR